MYAIAMESRGILPMSVDKNSMIKQEYNAEKNEQNWRTTQSNEDKAKI